MRALKVAALARCSAAAYERENGNQSLDVVLLPALPAGPWISHRSRATFSYPLYSKWFLQYANLKGTDQLSDRSVRAIGIRQALRGHGVDFGASGSPMSDERICPRPRERAYPTHPDPVLGFAGRRHHNLPGVTAPSSWRRGSSPHHFLRANHQVERNTGSFDGPTIYYP